MKRVKELKALTRKLNATIKQIDASQKAQIDAESNYAYDSARLSEIDATADLFELLSEIVSVVSVLGSVNGHHGLYTSHKIVTYNIKD